MNRTLKIAVFVITAAITAGVLHATVGRHHHQMGCGSHMGYGHHKSIQHCNQNAVDDKACCSYQDKCDKMKTHHAECETSDSTSTK